MKIVEFISEVSKPVGTIYLRFKVIQSDRGNVLTAYAGFANNPKELKYKEARFKFHKLHNLNDIVDMIQSIMKDNIFAAAKSMTIYMDLPDGFIYNAYEEFPFIKNLVSWVSMHGGDVIKLQWPEGSGKIGDPPKRKENPHKDIDTDKQYDLPDPNYMVYFKVSDDFYNTIRQSLPGIMQFKGPGKEFRMPEETFQKFKDIAEKKFKDAGIEVIKKAHVSESFGLDFQEYELDERGPASRSLCLSKKPNSALGASQLASCKSQGLRAREGGKTHKMKDGKRVKVGGHKIKGATHGGPLPDWGTREKSKKK